MLIDKREIGVDAARNIHDSLGTKPTSWNITLALYEQERSRVRAREINMLRSICRM